MADQFGPSLEELYPSAEELWDRPSLVACRGLIEHYEDRINRMRLEPDTQDLPDAGLRVDRRKLVYMLVEAARVEFRDPEPKGEPVFRFDFTKGDWDVQVE